MIDANQDPYAFIPSVNGRVPTRLRELVDLIATTDDPEVIVEFEDAMAEHGERFRDYIHDLVKHVHVLRAFNDATDKEIKRLEALQTERAIRDERITDAIGRWMLLVGENSIMYEDATIRVKLNPEKVLVEDETAIPPEFMATKTTVVTSPDKRAILDALKNNIHVSGCKITRTTKTEIK